jgi:hypothetical protein
VITSLLRIRLWQAPPADSQYACPVVAEVEQVAITGDDELGACSKRTGENLIFVRI